MATASAPTSQTRPPETNSPPEQPTRRQTLAVWNLLIGLMIGVLGQVMFYGRAIGLSFPLFIAIVVIATLALTIPAGRRVHLRNLWTLIPMGFFAAMVAIRADPIITTLNVLAVLTLGALTLHYLPFQQRFIDLAGLAAQATAVFVTTLSTLFEPFAEFVRGIGWLRTRKLSQNTLLVAVLRGLAIAIPVLIVFGALLSGADAIFADYLGKVGQWFVIENFDRFVPRILVTLFFAWLAVGALAHGLGRPLNTATVVRIGAGNKKGASATEADDDEWLDEIINAEDAPTEKKKRAFSLGFIESSIVLGSVDVLFALFVLVQFAYFFGGIANVGGVDGLTYAEYARRGFFELVAVSLLTLGLVLFLDWATTRDGVQDTVFRVMSVVMVLLTLVMLASAWRRMALYEEAFGFTHLRVYVHVFMAWMAVLFVVFLASLFRLRQNAFALGVMLVTIGYLGTLNLMNVDRYIIEHNITRYYNGEALDVAYLRDLSLDATPPIVAFYNQTEPDTEAHNLVGQWLALRWFNLERLKMDEETTLFSTNLGRDRAFTLLSDISDTLPDYDPNSPLHNNYSYASRDVYYEPAVTPAAR